MQNQCSNASLPLERKKCTTQVSQTIQVASGLPTQVKTSSPTWQHVLVSDFQARKRKQAPPKWCVVEGHFLQVLVFICTGGGGTVTVLEDWSKHYFLHSQRRRHDKVETGER